MLQVSSTNITFNASTAIPFENIILNKGCAEKLSAPATIQLEQRGVYLIKVDGYGTGAAAGENIIQLYINNVPQPQAQTQFTTDAAGISNFNFSTLIQVSQNNCNCNCYSAPTICQILNGAQELTDAHINVIVTKLC